MSAHGNRLLHELMKTRISLRVLQLGIVEKEAFFTELKNGNKRNELRDYLGHCNNML